MFSFGMLPWWLKMVKESAHNARDSNSIPGLGRSPGGGHGNSLQYSGLENPHGQRRLVGYSPWVTESDMTEHLSTQMFSFTCNSCAELSPSQPQSLIFPNFRNDIKTNVPFVLYSPSLPSILDGSINQGESTSDTSLNPSSSMLMHI